MMTHEQAAPGLFSIVIPFHNEEDSLRILTPELLDVLSTINRPFEILFVDDFSTDDGAKIVESFMDACPEIILIRQPHRGGQTGAFKTAFEQMRGEFVLRMDADLQDDPKEIPHFLEKIDEGAELVLGLRSSRKHPLALRILANFFELFVILSFNSPLHAHSASFVAFKASLMRNIPFRHNDHRYLPLIALKRGAQNPTEVIVRHRSRRFGSSHYRLSKKVILGIPEGFLFLARLFTGYYDVKD